MINVSWRDAQVYVEWLSREAGQVYRLPSEAEWEYACRAGTTTPFSFGETITPSQVNYDGNYTYAGSATGVYRKRTVEVGSLPANPWGLHEMHGNVWEWVRGRLARQLLRAHRWTARPGRMEKENNPLAAASSAAVPGTSLRGTSVRPTASGTLPSTASTFSGSAWPGRFLRTLIFTAFLLGVQGRSPWSIPPFAAAHAT